jgi:ABC-type phosphate transport system substrate-binding protein
MKKLILSALLAASMVVKADILVLYNEPITNITRDELYSIYTLRKATWDTGTSIQVYMLPASLIESVQFANLIAGTSPQRLRRIQELTDLKSFSKVRQLNASEEVAQNVITYIGSIGYARKDVPISDTVSVIVFE